MTTLTPSEYSTGLIKQGDMLSIFASSSALLMLFDGDVEIEKLIINGPRLIGPFYKGYRFKIHALSGNVDYSLVSSADAGYNPLSLRKGVGSAGYADGKEVLHIAENGNQLINVLPTLRARPYNVSDVFVGSQRVVTGTSTIDVDVARADPGTNFAMAKLTIPAGESGSFQRIKYNDTHVIQPGFTMTPDDVWMVVLYLPEYANEIEIELRTADQNLTDNSTNYRYMRWTASNTLAQMNKGYNILSALHVEDYVGDSDYGHVGTTGNAAWALGAGATQSESTDISCINICARLSAPRGEDTVIYIGAIYTAPAGWAKPAVMWQVDDVPISFYNNSLPIIESNGWKCTFNSVSSYAAGVSGSAKITLHQYLDLIKNGHEVWGHTRNHEVMTSITTAEKSRAIKYASEYYKSKGMQDACKFMCWPQGQFDSESIQFAKDFGYRLATSTRGGGINPFMPAVNPYYINRIKYEFENPWQVDSYLNGNIKRGIGTIAFGHNSVVGGEGTNTYPADISHYTAHLKRWCDLVKQYEADGKCIVTTPVRYFKMCGINPYTHDFSE